MKKRKVVSYIRVSTDEQAEGQSLEVQAAVTEDYAKGHNLEIVARFEASESAFKPGRPVFGEMLKYLRNHKSVASVLCYRQDRLARNAVDYATLVDELGIAIVSATENLSLNASGRFMMDINAAQARYFSAQLSERVTGAMLNKAKKGEYPTGAPTGYVNNKLERTIEIDPIQGAIVRELFETYANTDMSLMHLVKWAKTRGLRTRKGNAMGCGAIHNLLTNPVYYGAIRWRDVVYEGKHTPLVSRALFDRVQDKLHGRGRTKHDRRFPFRGLLVCGHCGCRITATLAKGKYIYYHCTNGKGKCAQGYISQKDMAQLCESVVTQLHMPQDVARMLLEEVRKGEAQRRKTLEKRIASLSRERTELTSTRDRAYVDKLNSVIDEERWQTLDSSWEERLRLVAQKEEEMTEALNREGVRDLESTLELLQRATGLFSAQDPFEKAEGLKIVVSNLVLTDRKLVPNYNPPFGLVALGTKTGNWYPQQDSNSS